MLAMSLSRVRARGRWRRTCNRKRAEDSIVKECECVFSEAQMLIFHQATTVTSRIVTEGVR
jgi:hypothetical protein